MDFGIWLLIGAALVFFMHAGFAMIEAGFTRAKNAANIIMKTLTDLCLGTISFTLIGFSLMCAEDYLFGVVGVPNLGIFTNFSSINFSWFVINLLFCATAATIVSGAMAERTKFSAYCIFSIVMSAVIYPIEAGWVWNANGWLAQMGFIDFAGSSVIHLVGGISAFIGAFMLGPRLGKYTVDKETGKKIVRAIPGHSLTLGALGCFILWFGWYGFNGAAAENLPQLGAIFLTTTIAAAAGTMVTMLFTWFKNGKPDVSMSLNGALAGLVAITAGCSSVDAIGSFVIGAVAGVLVVIAVEFIDLKLHVDDPVGAVAVHGVNGLWGILAVGLFARPLSVGADVISDTVGLFYGGGFGQLGIQAVGALAIAAWTVVTISVVFFIIKKTHGLRANVDDEIIGLDVTAHGLASSYADFLPVANSDLQMLSSKGKEKPVGTTAVIESEATVPVTVATVSSVDNSRMAKVTIITRQSRLETLKEALDQIGITGITVTNVLGYGIQRGNQIYRGVPVESHLLPKIQVDIVIRRELLDRLIKTAKRVLYTGNIGDGKIFIYDVENVIKVRTGEEGQAALWGSVTEDK
ncbi:MAG: ammonium transporter [Candidatus Bathyarchaeota archaeon]|nr:ammonium transporter [Candidatus Termiticorpusculum sp.]